MKLQLRQWSLLNNIPHTSLTSLLSILRQHPCFNNLPKHAKTFLKTPRATNIREMPPGQYCYFGILPILTSYLRRYSDRNENHISLQIGIDGLPISRSSENQLWPILCSIVPYSEVFLIGCYFGMSKPSDPNLFLEDFVEECKTLYKSGVKHDNKVITFSIHSLIGDAPAKSFFTSTKGHSGYHSCLKCDIKGCYIMNRVCFPGINFKERTDEPASKQFDKHHHKEYCKLAEIPDFGLVTNIPLDYMHLVCIGVVKKLIKLWLTGSLKVRLPAFKVKQITESLKNVRKYIPKEFSRKPRDLEDVNKWKATELRQILLYTGPFISKKMLSPEIYENFIFLHTAIQILLSPKLHMEKINDAEKFLEQFVLSFERIYGNHFMSYNIHNLLHLANDVRKFGTLDTFSAFKYENYMKTIKGFIRKADRPLQQLCNRYAELKACENINQNLSHLSKETFHGIHFKGPLLHGYNDPQYSKTFFENCILTTESPNNCCILKDKCIISISNFATPVSGSVYVIGKKFSKKKCVYQNPLPSSFFNCFRVSNISKFEAWPVSSIDKKIMLFPQGKYYAAVPLLHCDISLYVEYISKISFTNKLLSKIFVNYIFYHITART